MLEKVGGEALATVEEAGPGTRTGAVRAAALAAKLGSVLARDRTLPLATPLAGLFPEGGLRRGSTVVVGPGRFPGATALALALLSGPCAGGSWCAVVGAPDLGLVAAVQLGIDLERLALVPAPGPQWPVVMAALLEGFDVVLLRPPGPVGQSDARKLEARARERGSVLAVLGDHWPVPADIRLSIPSGCWRGLEDGYGYLASREVEVVAGGRGAASRPRQARLWLGGIPLGLVDGAPPPAAGRAGDIAVAGTDLGADRAASDRAADAGLTDLAG
jgi:hypothetical protein